MSILNNFFNKKPADGSDQNKELQFPTQGASDQEATPDQTTPDAQQQNEQGVPTPNKPDRIRAFDSFGREVFIPREEWRTNFLEKSIKETWDDADKLSYMLLKALDDGFEAEIMDAAKHLCEIDPKKERGWTILGITYMANDDLDNANKVFNDYIEQFGESGVILTNLAKVCARRGENTVAMEMLWHSLELDPNQENGFMWYVSTFREKSVEAAKEAVNRIAALPNAWRARLWQSHDALEQGHPEIAISTYEDILGKMEKPISPDVLQQISGDLGSHGYLPEILRLIGPLYQPAIHGVIVGNNLIKAHLDLGQLDIAKALVEMLFSMKRPDWHKQLSFWDMEIAKAKSELASFDVKNSAQIELLAFDGPTWLRRDIPVAEQTPVKDNPPIVVAITSCSFEGLKNDDGTPKIKVSNIPGITSRALSAFLVEQVHLRTNAVGRVLQPWLANENGGFALFGAPCDDQTACTLAHNSPVPAGYIAVPHIKEESEQSWTVTLKFINTSDSSDLGTITQEINPKDLEPGFKALCDTFLKLLEEKANVKPVEAPAFYQIPTGIDFSNYQLRLEQALIVSISATSPARSRSLHGEREIVEGTLRMCLANPLNGTLRLVLARILSDMRRIHPSVVEEYRERIEMLEKAQAAPEPVLASVQQLLSRAFQG